MKVRLYVGEEEFLIEECEGAPEIRRASAAKSMADRSVTAYPFDDGSISNGSKMPVSVRVEAAS